MLVDPKEPMPVEDRFWDKVLVLEPDECWEWQAYTTPKGIPKFSFKGLSTGAYRVAYELTYGPIPEDQEVCHSCDNKKCCNPKHLWIGTHKQNMEDLTQKGYKVSAKGERHGRVKLTNEQVMMIRKDNRTQVVIAGDYGVSRSRISHIQRKLSWRHI